MILTFDVLKLVIFNDIKELHPENIEDMLVTFDVLKLFIFNDDKELHPLNI